MAENDSQTGVAQPPRTALLPVAGLGTRLRPWSYAAAKALLPLVDDRGRIRPVLHHILAEACSAGIDTVGVIVSPDQREPLENYLRSAGAESEDLPAVVEWIVQPEPAGFGDAVRLGRDVAGQEPFLLMLGDHVHLPAANQPGCAAQLVDAFASLDAEAVVGVQPVDERELPRVGVPAGQTVKGQANLYRCTDFVEKPGLDVARKRLRTPRPAGEAWLGHAGLYVFTEAIFHALDELAGRKQHGELQLADAQRLLLDRQPDRYYLREILGRALDVGTPAGYAETFRAVREATAAAG